MKLFSITFYFLLFVSFFHTQIPAVNAIAPDPTSACGGFWNWFTHHYDSNCKYRSKDSGKEHVVDGKCEDGGKHHIGAISWTKLVCKPFITAHRCVGPANNPVCQTESPTPRESRSGIKPPSYIPKITFGGTEFLITEPPDPLQDLGL
ncbi:hypothetical protein EV360DRAFT_66539 [Lentinula raphanica]|nr:hypothetical protein EV360DRAFT_66539 [Lentinula raphanica]